MGKSGGGSHSLGGRAGGSHGTTGTSGGKSGGGSHSSGGRAGGSHGTTGTSGGKSGGFLGSAGRSGASHGSAVKSGGKSGSSFGSTGKSGTSQMTKASPGSKSVGKSGGSHVTAGRSGSSQVCHLSVNPNSLHFTEENVKGSFSKGPMSGINVRDAVAGIKSGKLDPSSNGPLQVHKGQKGEIWCENNRSLLVVRLAGVPSVDVKVKCNDFKSRCLGDPTKEKLSDPNFLPNIRGSDL